MNEKRRSRPAARVAFLGLMLALALALAFAESLLPAFSFLPYGVKPGLSNIVTMYCLFFLGFREAFTVALLKSLFVLLTRGPVGAAMSFAGGLLSVCAMALLQKRAPALHTTFVSVTGAVSHNMGQLFMAALILRNWFALAYLPVLFLAGVVMGLLTGVLLKTILPYLAHLDKAWK